MVVTDKSCVPMAARTVMRYASSRLSSSGRVLSEEERAAGNVYKKGCQILSRRLSSCGWVLSEEGKAAGNVYRSGSQILSRRFSSSGRVLSDEGKSAENVYVNKVEKESRSMYKLPLAPETCRRLREEYTLHIPKCRLEENRRQHELSFPFALRRECKNGGQHQLDSLASLIVEISSNDFYLEMKATEQLRHLLSMDNPPIEEVVKSGFVPFLVQFLRRTEHPKLQFEAAWSLTNILSGNEEHTWTVINSGAVTVLVGLLGAPSYSVRWQAVWALGNMAGSSPESRDYLLNIGVLNPLLSFLYENWLNCSILHPDSGKIGKLLEYGTWTLAQFCRGRPHPPLNEVAKILLILQRFLSLWVVDVRPYACWAAYFLTEGEGTDHIMRAIIEESEYNICFPLVLCLHLPQCFTLSLWALGNILRARSYGYGSWIARRTTVFDSCLVLKRMIDEVGTTEIVQDVIDCGWVSLLVSFLQNDSLQDAVGPVLAFISVADNQQIKYLVSRNCLRPLCDVLVLDEDWVPPLVLDCLKGIEKILEVGEADKSSTGGANYFALLVADAEGVEKIESLKNHCETKVAEKSRKILETYFVEDDEGLPGAVAGNV